MYYELINSRGTVVGTISDCPDPKILEDFKGIFEIREWYDDRQEEILRELSKQREWDH